MVLVGGPKNGRAHAVRQNGRRSPPLHHRKLKLEDRKWKQRTENREQRREKREERTRPQRLCHRTIRGANVRRTGTATSTPAAARDTQLMSGWASQSKRCDVRSATSPHT